nr:hexamerin [Eurygaster integriceps]
MGVVELRVYQAAQMLPLLTILLAATAASASVLPQKTDRKLADPIFLNHQKHVLDLFMGITHNMDLNEESSKFDISANLGSFTDEKYPKEFLKAYKRGLLPKNGIFTLFCSHTRSDAIKLFDLFFFAKDVDTFLKVASWAKVHINPVMFAYAYALALIHRSDTQQFQIPPAYEVFPNFFTPIDTLHHVFDYKMEGIKEGRFTYNNSGYEYNYHESMFGGLLSPDNRGYGDFRISYLREDVGLGDFFVNARLRNPSWMSPVKYNSPWLKRRGERFYYRVQQILARYSLERFSHGLPNTESLYWERPIKVGYNPRVAYVNGQNMYNRPDNLIPEFFNPRQVNKMKNIERRIYDVIDARSVWDLSNGTLVSLQNENGIEILGEIVQGANGSISPQLYRSPYYMGIEALAFVTTTANDRSYIGNALSSAFTALRDPMFFNYLTRINRMFQHFKKTLGPYNHDEVAFKGVQVQNVEVDKFVTYFDMFEYEVGNAVPMQKRSDFKEHKYYARQFRLNHKPYHFNITVNSEQTCDAIIRVFIGQNHDADMRRINVKQARLSFFEIDRFIVKMNTGVNVFERNSKESPFFVNDLESFRSLYENINNAINQKSPYYVSQSGRCGAPDRFQLPMGWKGGRPAQLAVVVSSYDPSSVKAVNKNFDIACGGDALHDGRPMGFPFDREPHHGEFHLPNIYFKDVDIYHKEQTEVNRPTPA